MNRSVYLLSILAVVNAASNTAAGTLEANIDSHGAKSLVRVESHKADESSQEESHHEVAEEEVHAPAITSIHADGESGNFDHAGELAKAKEAHHKQAHEVFDYGSELTQLENEAEMIPGLGNPSDLANRAMDMMNGAAGIIPEDYPFVCVCLATGVCDEPMPEGKKTPCPGRIGQMAGTTRAPLAVAAALAALGLAQLA